MKCTVRHFVQSVDASECLYSKPQGPDRGVLTSKPDVPSKHSDSVVHDDAQHRDPG